MGLFLDVLHENRDRLNDLDLNQSVFKCQKARHVALEHILFDQLIEIDCLSVFLTVDEEFCEISNLLDDEIWTFRCKHLHIFEVVYQ